MGSLLRGPNAQRFMTCITSQDPWEKMINDADAIVGNCEGAATPVSTTCDHRTRDSMLSTISLVLSFPCSEVMQNLFSERMARGINPILS